MSLKSNEMTKYRNTFSFKLIVRVFGRSLLSSSLKETPEAPTLAETLICCVNACGKENIPGRQQQSVWNFVLPDILQLISCQR